LGKVQHQLLELDTAEGLPENIISVRLITPQIICLPSHHIQGSNK
jgi:hypothetical protein